MTQDLPVLHTDTVVARINAISQHELPSDCARASILIIATLSTVFNKYGHKLFEFILVEQLIVVLIGGSEGLLHELRLLCNKVRIADPAICL